MLSTTNSLCNDCIASQFTMASNGRERSRSPKAADSKGDTDDSQLDEKFLALWTKHLEPKMQDANNNMQKRDARQLKKELTFIKKQTSL